MANETSSNEMIWVLGGGHFGQRAVEMVRRTTPNATIVVVEKMPDRDLSGDIEVVGADGVEWLVEKLTPEVAVTKIIPALPLHLAAEWLKKKLLQEGIAVSTVDIPDEILSHLPYPIRQNPCQLVVSHADFLCPPHCVEPDKYCTYTRKRRPLSLYKLLETVEWGVFTPLIIRSRQFAHGVGGFYPEDLWNLLQEAMVLPDTPLLVGTACKCHGIVDGIMGKSI